MSTLTITRDRLVLDLETGDRITAIDGHQLRRPHEVLVPRIGAGLNRIDAVALVNQLGTPTEWNLYPGNIERDITIERAGAAPEPQPAPEPARPVEGDLVTLTSPKGTVEHLTRVPAPDVYGVGAVALCGRSLGLNVAYLGTSYGKPWDGTADGVCPRCARAAAPVPPAPPRRRRPAQRTGLRRVEPGVYEHPDGRYRVERIDSMGEGWSQARQEFVYDVTTSSWVVTERPEDPRGEWEEVTLEWPSKRAAVDALEKLVRENPAAVPAPKPVIQNSAIGGITLPSAGLRSTSGTDADWGVIRRARKQHHCAHKGPWSARFDTECQHPTIEPGEMYLLTKQGYLDADPLALECALAAGLVERPA
jgi:hypothetical protein